MAAIVVLCVAAGGGYVAIAALSGGEASTEAAVSVVPGEDPPSFRGALAGRRVLVRAIDPGDPGRDGRVTLARLGMPGRARETSLACERVHMRAGSGLCLAAAVSGLGYKAVIFDRGFRRRHELLLEGLPSRARVSPDGRFGSVTMFVTGHSYAAAGQFSTSTEILDLTRGKRIGALEEFEVYRRGRKIDEPDFNFWGTTFARDGRTFYATLSTGDHRYLVRGDVPTRRVDVLRDSVECPSLSPEGRRIAYKRPAGDGRWRLHVLDLRTGDDRALAERRSIDDQIEWLDRRRVLYGDGRDVWTADADGGGRPRRALIGADSPAALDQ